MTPVWLKSIVAFLQPPGLILLLLLFGLYSWLVAKKFRAGLVIVTSTLLLYLFSIPLITNKLINNLEKTYSSANFEKVVLEKKPKAIVVLSSSKWPNSNGVLRNLYAAKLASITKLPVLVSGGGNDAASIAKSLGIDFGVTGAIWVDSESRNTIENAKFTKKILEKNNINDIFLVTNAWHMPRAIQVFSKQGINIIPAPVLSNLENSTIMAENLLPRGEEMVKSEVFFHEHLGVWWYKLISVINSEGLS